MRVTDPISPGMQLPERRIPVAASRIVGGAIITRDFQQVHHDQNAARAAGCDDIFLNILTTQGMVESYVTDWAPPYHRLISEKIKLGARVYPGDTLILTGIVDAADGERIHLQVRGHCRTGLHVQGRFVLGMEINRND